MRVENAGGRKDNQGWALQIGHGAHWQRDNQAVGPARGKAWRGLTLL